MVTILSWLWRQSHGRMSASGPVHYGAEHVNVWADMVRRNLTADAEIACVTDIPDGIDPSVRIIPLPDMPKVENKHWPESSGQPQCYRRLHMYRPDAADVFGTERILMMDLDCVVAGNIDHLVNTTDDLKFMQSAMPQRWVNGSMQFIRCGARPEVWTRFNQKEAQRASRKYVGSDQAWISYILGDKVKLFGRQDGVISYKPRMLKVPQDICVMFFPGRINPWDHEYHGLHWVTKHYKRTKT